MLAKYYRKSGSLEKKEKSLLLKNLEEPGKKQIVGTRGNDNV